MVYTLETRLADTRLSVRSVNACHAMGVDTVNDLLEYDTKNLMRVRGFGKLSKEELDHFRQDFINNEVSMKTYDEVQPSDAPLLKVGGRLFIPCKNVERMTYNEFLVDFADVAMIKQSHAGAILNMREGFKLAQCQCVYKYETLVSKLQELQKENIVMEISKKE